MLTLFPAALCIGATFPFAVRILARSGDDAGPVSARVYSANTVGSIVGSVGAGFFILPNLGFAGTLLACVATNCLLAASAALLFEPRRRVLAAVACAGALALAVFPPATPWKMLRMSAMQALAGGPVVHFGVGRSATVLLTRREDEYRLRTNGLPESGVIRKGSYHNRYPLTRWLSALPVMARPQTRRLLVVGLGGGSTVEVVPASVERVDVVELEPEVLEANHAMADLRWRDPLLDPRVHIHLNDARNALLLADQAFDAIVSQPSHPWSGGAAHLYTREFFELVSSRLSPDGVFVQWIGLSFVDAELFAALLAALDEVFEHVRVYGPPPGYGVLFIASNSPLNVEETTASALAASPEEFALMGVRVTEEVSAGLLLDEAGVRALSEGAVPNSDGHNQLQSRSGFLKGRSLRWDLHSLLSPYDPLTGERPPGEDFFFLLRNLTSERALSVAEALQDPVDRKVAEALGGMAAGNRVVPRKLLVEVLEGAPRNEEARAALLRLSVRAILEGRDPEEILEPPLSEAEWVLIEGWRARELAAGDPRALEALEESLAALPIQHPLATDATRLRIDWRLRSADPERILEAERLAEESLGQWPDSASLLLRAQTSIAAGHYAAGLDALRMVGERVDRKGRLADAHLIRAYELLRATPMEPELAWLRERAERELGSGR
jgi:spermidine synthase